MTNMTVTPTSVQNAVYALENFLLGNEETQVFWAELGAVVLTDDAVYEIYATDEGVVVQERSLERANGWEDISDSVLKHV